MATSTSHEIAPHSVLRPQGSDPLASTTPAVHLRNPQRTRYTEGMRPKKAPLPPGPISVYGRGSLDRDLRIGRANSVPNGSARTDSITSGDLRLLPVIEEDHNVSSIKYSRQSIVSDSFDWLDDDESTVFQVIISQHR